MSPRKHIAMWTCRRSRSTVTTRSFEQREDCIVYNAPFYPPYLLHKGDEVFDPHRDDVFERFETNYDKVIEEVTGDLPDGKLFSFQKHVVQEVLPEFGRNWLDRIHHFFLIRHPGEILFSYYQLQQKLGQKSHLTIDDIGLDALYNMFCDVRKATDEIPLVMDATDLVKNPAKSLQAICDRFDVPFSEKMLSWQPGLEKSFLQDYDPSPDKKWIKTWYSNVVNSSGFLPYEQKQIHLPEDMLPLLEECLPFYEKIFSHRLSF